MMLPAIIITPASAAALHAGSALAEPSAQPAGDLSGEFDAVIDAAVAGGDLSGGEPAEGGDDAEPAAVALAPILANRAAQPLEVLPFAAAESAAGGEAAGADLLERTGAHDGARQDAGAAWAGVASLAQAADVPAASGEMPVPPAPGRSSGRSANPAPRDLGEAGDRAVSARRSLAAAVPASAAQVEPFDAPAPDDPERLDNGQPRAWASARAPAAPILPESRAAAARDGVPPVLPAPPQAAGPLSVSPAEAGEAGARNAGDPAARNAGEPAARNGGEREPGRQGGRDDVWWRPNPTAPDAPRTLPSGEGAAEPGRAEHSPFAALDARAPEPTGAERAAGDVQPRAGAALPPIPDGAMRAVASGAAASPRPAGPDSHRAENIDRLVQTVRVQVRNGISEATVRLRPEHLGEVTIAIRVDGRAVSAIVHAESADVREWLQAQESTLRGSLVEHGLHLDRLYVHRDGRHDRQERPPSEGRRLRVRQQTQQEPRFEVIV
jgi:hypothetical protein